MVYAVSNLVYKLLGPKLKTIRQCDDRPSQLARQGVQALADKLTESLRVSGDLAYTSPAALSNA